MKISNIWNNFDEFSKLVKTSGTVEAKKRLKILRNDHFKGETFIGDWEELFKFIVFVVNNCTRIFNKFEYTDAEFEVLRDKLRSQNFVVQRFINKVLKSNYYEGIGWNSPTPFYKNEDILFLNTKLKSVIIGYTNYKNEGICEFKLTNKKENLVVTFMDGEFENFSTEENGNVVDRNYPEVIRFIKTKYFNHKYSQPISYKNLRYLLMCLRDIKPFLSVPIIESGVMNSNLGSRILKGETEVIDYLKITDNLNVTNTVNVLFTQIDFHKFVIERESDKTFRENLLVSENQYADKRARFPLSPKSTKR